MAQKPVPQISDYERRVAQNRPRVSVITTVFNAEKTLDRAIASLRSQNLPDLEYIIIDAGSRDRTLDIVQANAGIVTFWKSEPDRGISDGFNKGIALSSGEYILLLNADDWLSPAQIASGVETLKKTGADFVFGDLIYHDAAGAPLHKVKGDAAYARRIAHAMPALNHPTVIVRRATYEAHGLFDLELRYAMDYDLLLRFHRAGCKGVYDHRMTGHMTLDGASDRHAARGLREMRDVAIRHGYPAPLAHALYYFRRLKGRTRRMLNRLLPPGIAIGLRRIFNANILSIK